MYFEKDFARTFESPIEVELKSTFGKLLLERKDFGQDFDRILTGPLNNF